METIACPVCQVKYSLPAENGSIKSAMFGGEGLVFATLTGPGPIWLQSLPFARLAQRFTSRGAASKEQGSVLDTFGGLGGMLMGDNR